MLSKGPKWPLRAEAPALSASTQPPFNLTLLSASTWLSSEWKRKERASCCYLLSHALSFSSGYLVRANRCAHRSCHRRRTDVKIEKREPCRHVTAEVIGWGKGGGGSGRWKHKRLSRWGRRDGKERKGLIILLSISSHGAIKERWNQKAVR